MERYEERGGGRSPDGVVLRLPEPAEPDRFDDPAPGPAADPDPDDDGGLWRDLRAGDEGALRTLFVRHGRAVYNFAFRSTGSWSVAEDVAQATFTTVWRRAVTGDLPELRLASARPILFAFARKEGGNQLRSARRQARLAVRLAGERGKTAADDTGEWLAAEAAMRQIDQALRVLPRQQREVIALVCWSGLTPAEAAAALGVPVGTIKSRLSRARRRLADTPLAALLTGGAE
ncbi:MAG TPA: sigma-70 family RNA polymerase sigma factor [Microlunatus sp.]|nr:sigma-70 family RNA polymerase sigma factor [Microlunatus sp.]